MEHRSLDDLGPPLRSAKSRYWRGVIWGTLSGWGLVFVPYMIVLLIRYFAAKPEGDWPSWMYDYNVSLLLLLPLVQGLAGGLAQGRETQSGSYGLSLVGLVSLLDILVAAIFMREGIICLIMASPLLLALIALGYAVGRWLARWRRSKTLSVSLAPLVMLAVVGETTGPAPNYPAVVVDEVTVNAPPEYVWRYIVDYPDNPNPPDYWLWQAGLPAPTHSVAPVQAVGARRDCKFTGDQAFEEKIVELVPNKKLVFDITKQPDHPEIIGHITVDRGEMVLRPNADGSTTIVASSWYRLHVRPAPYFAWWAEDVTRHIHFRVMGYMKTLAERDYQADQAKQGK